MPAFREQERQTSILNRLPRTGFSGCFENRSESFSTGEQVWALLSQELNDDKARTFAKSHLENGKRELPRVGQSVWVNFGRRRASGTVIRCIPCSPNVEICLRDPSGTRVVVDQHDVEIVQNTEECYAASPKTIEVANADSLRPIAPLVIDIPNDTDCDNQNRGDAEEKMAAAVLTSLCLSPVLKNIQDEAFEDAMNTENVSDEGLFSPTLSDQENNNAKQKLRRRQASSKTLFQCTWPGCGKVLTNSSAIVRHVRAVHLGPKNNKDEGYSDGEEEFYFIEIERNKGDITDHSSEESIIPPLTRLTSRRCRSFSDPSVPTQPPVSSSRHLHVDDNFIWPLRQAGGRGKAKRPLHQTVHSNTRKARGDGKKCRKVFGMENKQLWCTQCRWKKACVKFVD